MIYFLHGTDTHKSRNRMHEILQSLLAKRPNSEVFKITPDSWSENQFDELISSQGLFEQKYVVVLDFVFGDKTVKEYVVDKLAQMKDSEHWFVILDGKVDVGTARAIEKVAFKTQVFEKIDKKKDSPIIFTITDKLLNRDKKRLWISYVDLIEQKIPAEEIHGVLFWAVKNMIIASRVDSQKESGLAPFSYSKALSGTRNFKTEELKKMSGDLVEMVHKVRSGEGEMGVMLEKWVLTI